MIKFLCFILIVVGVSASRPSVNAPGSDRIVGGTGAQKGDFPFQVSLRNSAGNHFCGGAIIASRFILTSAQCVRSATVKNVIAFVGAHTPTDGTKHVLDRITQHPNFNWDKRENDIAVLRTATPIIFNNLTQPIALPKVAVEDGRLTLVTGWGRLNGGGSPAPPAPILNWSETTVINTQECRDVFPGFEHLIHENTVCTRNPLGVGVCGGDFGGPLTTKLTPRVRALVAISSWASDDCGLGSPDVYADVFQHLPFIRKAMQ